MARKPTIGEIRAGRKPKSSPEGARWVQFGPADQLKGPQRWQLVEIRTFEQDERQAPFMVPREVGSGKEATQAKLPGFSRTERE